MLIGSIPGDLSASGYEQHFGSGLLVAHENGWSTLFWGNEHVHKALDYSQTFKHSVDLTWTIVELLGFVGIHLMFGYLALKTLIVN